MARKFKNLGKTLLVSENFSSYRFKLGLRWGTDFVFSGLRFATQDECFNLAEKLLEPPESVQSWDVVGCSEPPNFSYRDGKLERITGSKYGLQ